VLALNSQSLNHITYFVLSSVLNSLYSPNLNFLPYFLSPSVAKKTRKTNLTVIFVYITVFIVHDGVGEAKKGDVGGFELMYGWIKLSYPTPPPQGPFYSPSIAEIGFSSALCHSTPHRPPFGPINSRSRLNNKNHTMAAAFSVTGAGVGGCRGSILTLPLFRLTPLYNGIYRETEAEG
jgi:hypothetical protein